MVDKYKLHPAILLWGFGNEKNFYAPRISENAGDVGGEIWWGATKAIWIGIEWVCSEK